MEDLERREWLKSRDIEPKFADKIVNQLVNQYIYIRKALRGEPTPIVLLERELIQLVVDVQRGRFPVNQQTRSKSRNPK